MPVDTVEVAAVHMELEGKEVGHEFCQVQYLVYVPAGGYGACGWLGLGVVVG